MEKIPNKITSAFIKEVESLVDRGIAANHTEVAGAIKWNKTGMSLVMKRKRNVPNKVYKRFTAYYGLENGLETQPVVEPERVANGFKIDLTDKDKIISLLEERVSSLKEDNEALKKRLSLATTLVLEQVSEIHSKVETNQNFLADLLVKQKIESTETIDGRIDKENKENFQREQKRLGHIAQL